MTSKKKNIQMQIDGTVRTRSYHNLYRLEIVSQYSIADSQVVESTEWLIRHSTDRLG